MHDPQILGRYIIDNEDQLLDALTEEEELVRIRHCYVYHRR